MAQPDNIGNQIRDAVQNAVNSQDYSSLQSTIEQSINVAAVNIGRGLAQAQEEFRRAQEGYAQERQQTRGPGATRGAGAGPAANATRSANPTSSAAAASAHNQRTRAARGNMSASERYLREQEKYARAQAAHQVATESAQQRGWEERNQVHQHWAEQAQAIQQQYAQKAQAVQQQRTAQNREMEQYFASPMGPRVLAGGMIAGGVVTGAIFGSMLLLVALSGGNVASLGIFTALTACAVALVIGGAREMSFAQKYAQYRNLIGLRDHCDVSELALSTGESEAGVVKNLRKMLKRTLFKQGALDSDERTLIVTAEAQELYLQSKGAYEARKKQERLASSVSTEPGKKPLPANVVSMLASGEAYIAKFRLSNEAIPDPEITAKIDQIEHVVRTIFQRVEERPEAAGDLEQLMNYYLPTTAKLLDAYKDLDAQPIQGENILKSKREISGALDALAVAFEKLLDQVFQEMAWDVSADVSVLHTVLAQEGLTANPFEKK